MPACSSSWKTSPVSGSKCWMRLDLVAEEDRPVGRLGVGREHLEGLAAHPEGAAAEGLVVARVHVVDELAQHLVAVDHLALLQQRDLGVVLLRRAEAVDAGHRRHHDHVAPREQGARGGVPKAVDLLVDRGVLLDVEVLRRDVCLRLVVVVVRDEVLDRVLREELPELVAELGGERLVVGDHERGPLDLLDRERHRGRLARSGHSQQRLEAVTVLDPMRKPGHRSRLVGDGLIGGVELELRHDL